MGEHVQVCDSREMCRFRYKNCFAQFSAFKFYVDTVLNI